MDIKEGDYILSVDGVPAGSLSVIYQALIDKVDKTVALRVNSTPSETGARTVYVAIGDERDWYITKGQKPTSGKWKRPATVKIGYILIPDMSYRGSGHVHLAVYTQRIKKRYYDDRRTAEGTSSISGTSDP